MVHQGDLSGDFCVESRRTSSPGQSEQGTVGSSACPFAEHTDSRAIFTPAMRIWVDPKRLAARQLTVTDIEDALRRENVQMPSGRLESSTREFTLRTNTGSAIYTTFALALLIAYLVLAALFESFKHPLIIMTTVPLAITGALSRQSIGAVVFFGVSFSVLLTLVVVPSVYALLAKNTRSPEYVAQLIEGLSSASSSGQASET